MQYLNPIFLNLTMATLLLWPAMAHSHEFERGHIERSVDIVIRGRNVQIKYAIGLSDETIVDWLVREEAIESAEEQRFRKLIAEFENQEAGAKNEEATTEDSSASKETESVANVSEQPVEFQTELQRLLKEKLSEKIARNLRLACNDQELEVAETNFTASARHHVALELTVELEVPDVEVAAFVFKDENFLEFTQEKGVVSAEVNAEMNKSVSEKSDESRTPSKVEKFLFGGNIRLACRVKGNAVLLNSNVAPVLARAKVTEVGHLGGKERQSAASIYAKIAFAKQDKP